MVTVERYQDKQFLCALRALYIVIICFDIMLPLNLAHTVGGYMRLLESENEWLAGYSTALLRRPKEFCSGRMAVIFLVTRAFRMFARHDNVPQNKFPTLPLAVSRAAAAGVWKVVVVGCLTLRKEKPLKPSTSWRS